MERDCSLMETGGIPVQSLGIYLSNLALIFFDFGHFNSSTRSPNVQAGDIQLFINQLDGTPGHLVVGNH